MDEKRKLKRIIKEKGSRGDAEYEQKLHLELRKGNEDAVDTVLLRLASGQNQEILKTRHRMLELAENLKFAIVMCDFRDWFRDMDRLEAEEKVLTEKVDEWVKEHKVQTLGEKG